MLSFFSWSTVESTPPPARGVVVMLVEADMTYQCRNMFLRSNECTPRVFLESGLLFSHNLAVLVMIADLLTQTSHVCGVVSGGQNT